ncbi:MAG: DUF262 domain-containing protein [Muribaculum sp.]|nr:DUF262 domain-containing protein [Muribaculum sp.]
MAELKEYLFVTSQGQTNRNKERYGSIMGQNYYIPFLQRAYKWTPVQALQLLEDLKEFVHPNNTNKKYCMQPLAVCKRDNGWEVLDGQQRLTTLLLIYRILFDGNLPYTLAYERQSIGVSDCGITKCLMDSDISKDEVLVSNQDLYNMSRVRRAIQKWVSKNESCKKQLQELFQPGGKDLLFLWYEVTQDERHKTFQNLNTGKIALTNSDLVKALFLSNYSDNNTNGIHDKSLLAAQYREMEIWLENDRFWYAICPYDSDSEHPRIDFIFNLVANISPKEYWATEESARLSFDYLYGKKHCLNETWNDIRNTFIRLKDLVSDSKTYHYMGYLVYHSSSSSRIRERQRQKYKDTVWAVSEVLKLYKQHGFAKCVEEMQDLIRTKLNLDKELPGFDEKAQCRRVFVLHNIETILQRLDALKEAKLNTYSTENTFPFELLYSQDWDIEHIASQTENDLTSDKDREIWLSGLKSDYHDIYKGLKNKIDDYWNAKTKEARNSAFNELHKSAIVLIEKDMRDRGLTPISETEKDKIWNLVLLDDHTNRSYHNSLMPRKRKIILYAADQGCKEENIKVAYIPPCTLKVFEKSYNRDSQKLTTLDWIQNDAKAYEEDIRDKLKFYI